MVSGEDKDKDNDKDNDNDKDKDEDKDKERVRGSLSLFSPRGGYIYVSRRERKKLPPQGDSFFIPYAYASFLLLSSQGRKYSR